MKYRIIGAVACICILLVSVLNYPVLLTGRMESRRYHQHREATPKAVCAVHAEKEFCTHLPLIVIDTGGAEIPGRGLVDEEDRHMGFTTTAEGADRITAQMRVMDSAEENNHPTDAPAVESNVVIHVRGNSSRYFEKAGYRLELVDENGDNNPKSLMGMDAHHEWALHGPYLDKSLMRNYMWYNIAGECMEYAPNVRFCELMLNGEYQGIYVLTELIGSGRDGARLNMEVDARDNTYTGYLLRLDRQDGSEYDRLNSLTTYSYRNEMELKLEVEFPGEKKLTPEIKEAIKTDFSAFEKGLYSYDYDSRKYGYRAQVDVDSFVNYLILNEFTTNYDAGSYSTYIYRDVSGRLKMCVWDFNNACDNYQEQTTMQVQHFDVHRKLWFNMMVKDEYFTERVIRRYIASWSQGKELKELRASLETINKTSGTLISDIERHYKEICKERGIDPHAKAEPETAPIEQPTGNLTYYVAECMEFPNLGEYHDNLSLEEAVRIYQEIPAERMNGIKGIGFELKDGSDYEGPFPILTGHTIDLDTIQAIDYYRDNPLVQKAVKELAAAMPEMEVLGADANQQEALFLIDDATYLHIQPCDSGWDYTLYDVASMKELDGGQLDMPELSRMKAVLQICDDNDLGKDSVKYAPLSMIETLQEAAYQQMQAEVSQMTASSQLPEAQEQALDEYPMPDEQVSTPDMLKYGYSYDGMLPVTRERALELDAAGLTVYVLHEDNTESMVFDPQEIMEHGGLFGVDREEWEKSPQFHEKVMERQEHQQEREQAFLSQNRDCFAIYQVTRDDPQNVRFMNLDWLKSHDISIDRSNYDLIYTAPLSESGTVLEQLEKLYQQFNLEKPVDYHSPSMSVSDIVAIKQDGKVSCHYCDSVGFTQIPGFFSQNPLKNAEMTVEDDYGMIDGIINNGAKEPTVAELEQQARSGQPISLMDLADAVHREEREKKKSVVDQLKSQPKAEHKKTAPKKSAEREI